VEGYGKLQPQRRDGGSDITRIEAVRLCLHGSCFARREAGTSTSVGPPRLPLHRIEEAIGVGREIPERLSARGGDRDPAAKQLGREVPRKGGRSSDSRLSGENSSSPATSLAQGVHTLTGRTASMQDATTLPNGENCIQVKKRTHPGRR
jgi:hypothetical protein